MLNKLVIILLDSPIWGHFQWPPWTITASWTQFQTPYSANSSFSFDCKKFLQWLDERWFWFCGPLTHWYSKCSCSSRGIPGGSWETQIDPHLQSSRPGTEVFSELKKHGMVLEKLHTGYHTGHIFLHAWSSGCYLNTLRGKRSGQNLRTCGWIDFQTFVKNEPP